MAAEPSLDQKAKILALRDVASLINSGTDLHTILSHLVSAACRHAGWTMGGIMSVDVQSGYASVMCRYDPTLLRAPLRDRWALASSPAVIALSRNEPVFIPDARVAEEFPGYRQEAFERDYRSVLVVPMDCRDEEDRPMVLSVASREPMTADEDDLAFLRLIVHLGEIAVQKHHGLRDERRSAGRMRSALQTNAALLDQALAGATVATLADGVGRLLPHPIVVVDFAANQVVVGRSPAPDRLDDEAWRGGVDARWRESLLRTARSAVERGQTEPESVYLDAQGGRLGLTARIWPLTVDGEAVGALLVFGADAAFGDLDLMLLDSARFALSVQLMRNVVRFRFENQTLAEVFSEIVERRWREEADVLQRAQRLGLNLALPRQMIVAELPHRKDGWGATAIDLHHAASRALEQSDLAGVVLALPSCLVCLVASEVAKARSRAPRGLEALSDTLAHYLEAAPIVVMSERCASLADYAAAWERCRRTIKLSRTFGRTGVVSGQDFGPLPVLAAAADVGDVRAFVQDSIGAIAAYDRDHNSAYLATLSAFLREGCRSQACADALGLHVTTLRYRLSRIQELFGIEVETPERRFAVELAVHLHEVINVALS
jgi:purine catabolism regulator